MCVCLSLSLCYTEMKGASVQVDAYLMRLTREKRQRGEVGEEGEVVVLQSVAKSFKGRVDSWRAMAGTDEDPGYMRASVREELGRMQSPRGGMSAAGDMGAGQE